MAERLKGLQSLPAADKSDGKWMLDEPRIVDSPADFWVKMLDSTTRVRKMKAQQREEEAENRSVILAERLGVMERVKDGVSDKGLCWNKPCDVS